MSEKKRRCVWEGRREGGERERDEEKEMRTRPEERGDFKKRE